MGPITTASHLIGTLQPRQIEALGLLARGLSTREVATRMGIAERTLRAGLLDKAYGRLGLSYATGSPRTAACVAWWLAARRVAWSDAWRAALREGGGDGSHGGAGGESGGDLRGAAALGSYHTPGGGGVRRQPDDAARLGTRDAAPAGAAGGRIHRAA